MKRPLTVIAALASLLPIAQAFAASGTYTLPAASTTSAGIYDSSGVLVRSLWNNVHYNGGTYTARWNGLDDSGVLRPDGQYELRVLSDNVHYTWEGVLGNTSDNFTGPGVHHSLDIIFGMAVWNSTVYFATGYNEQLTSSYKTTTTNPQQNTKLLTKGAGAYHVTTDGTNVYWAARDPFIAGSSFVYVTRTSDDGEASLPNAVALPVSYGRTYTSAIDALSATGSAITGIAVQKTGDYLFVSRRALNRLDVLNKSTGALVRTLTYTSPDALAVDETNDLWMVTNDTWVRKFSVAVDGTLAAVGGLTSGLAKPLALAVSPDNSTLLVADGGSAQQVKAFTNETDPIAMWRMGQPGGYANGPAVTDDKFYFRNTNALSLGSDSVGPGADWAYMAFQPDGKLWVGDPGNYRTQRFNVDRTFLDRIQFMPYFYSMGVEPHDITRLFANFLEFGVDYSKPTGATNGSWTLVRNWGWGVPGNYWDALTMLRSVTTLPNGRTYALLRNIPVGRMAVVELPPTGNLRFTGIETDDLAYAIDEDGALRARSQCISPFVTVGTRITWKKRDLTGFDAANNPQWGALTVVATSPVLGPEDLCSNLRVMRPWEITSTGVLLAFADYNTPGFHLQGLNPSTGQWVWKAARSTRLDYVGPFPVDGSFDIGNFNGASSYAGGGHHASGRNIFWQFHGEGWKQGQTNKWAHLYDDGLMVGQFGEVSPDVGAWLPEAAAGMAGNGFSSAVVTAPDGSRYIYQNDEGQHGGVHRWHVTGLDTIAEQSIPVTLANDVQSGLRGTYYDDTGLSNLEAVTTRIDATIDFNWGAGAPAGLSAMNADAFSVRWQGFIKPAYSELYTFGTASSDGMRVWVNEALVVDNWHDAVSGNSASGTVSLEADKLYPITVEYYRLNDEGRASLSWSSASQAQEIVPASRLFFADTSASLPGTDIHEGLTNTTTVSDGMYGWHRDPAQDIENNWFTDWWQIGTGRYVYRRDLPVDIDASFSLSGTASLTRDLRPADATDVSHWSLGGKIAYGSNVNHWDYGQPNSAGHYLEILDDAGKIIARMFPNLYAYPNVTLVGNSGVMKVVDVNTWMTTLVDTPTPFQISAANGQITFSLGNTTAVPVNVFDPNSNWHKPTTLRLFFFQSGVTYPQAVGLAQVTFSSSP